MEGLEKLVRKLTWRTSQLGQVALAGATFVIVANIIMREVWKPLPGTVEVAEILGAILLSLGVAYCAFMKGHIAVGVLVDKLSRRKEAVVEFIVNLISLLFTSLLAGETFVYATRMMGRGYTTAHLRLPLHPVIYLVGFGFVMLALVLLKDVINSALIILYKEGSESK